MGDILRVLSAAQGNWQQTQEFRLTCEACENIHFHWRNVRLETSVADIFRMIEMMRVAQKRFLKEVAEKVVYLPLESICPYNDTHRKSCRGRGWECGFGTTDDTLGHEAGVDFYVQKMKEGLRPWPIAVRPHWLGGFPRPCDTRPGNVFQRLDGFKRYMAHAELGCNMIACFVLGEDKRGCQDGMPHPLRFDGDGLEDYCGSATFAKLGEVRLSSVPQDRQRHGKNKVELLRNGMIHIHIGDVRLEFNAEEFAAYAKLIRDAEQALQGG